MVVVVMCGYDEDNCDGDGNDDDDGSGNDDDGDDNDDGDGVLEPSSSRCHSMTRARVPFAQLTHHELVATLETVNIGVESGVCERDTRIEGDVVVRARGLPWQASDCHVAQFFAGLEIAPGGIALCLSAEGRRNGEALVRFKTPKMRELALKRHRHFLLSRYWFIDW
ncbi:unnamed protein product [Angiostrongylus costaricensis]|uniref:RRM domain-containing protein n=1 Tax=Angiostrongylus costaricensis TaxID=334426 RepID=A0A0R3PKV9_ANGCS|nr:unnamed protein product [Angiostrongylus costaricensis]